MTILNELDSTCGISDDELTQRFKEAIRIDKVENGKIIEQYPDDFPFPSCLILGKDENGDYLHVCMSDEGSASRIITAYYPDLGRWGDDFSTRKETK